MRGSDRMHALYLHFTDAPLSDYARAENHSAALQITFIFYSAEICMISKSRNSSQTVTSPAIFRLLLKAEIIFQCLSIDST